MSAVIEVDRVSKRFGALSVIDELSFSLEQGEALGVVGPNGAGKTTTLNMIAGDFRPTTGRVRFDGRDVTGLPAHRRCRIGIGRTSQVPRPFDGLTVFENVLVGASFGGAHRGHRARDVAVDALRRTGMLAKANVRAGELTLLERKRLELSRALSTEPKVLLLDEIAGGLTEGEVLELIDTIKSIHAAGVSIIWIEHIVHALLKVVDRMLAMDYGRKLIEGDPHEVMASDEVKNVYLGTEA
ncbi:MAG: ABC transporter ATP-binding protein [Actinomycetota bacterium]|nr:ABC transporter ATP-binding protein [Actinomycetota bacterium]